MPNHQNNDSATTETHNDQLKNFPSLSLFQANLDALRQKDSTLAQQLAETAIPACVQLAFARDGSATYCFQQSDGRKKWLGNSSVPHISAAALTQNKIAVRGNLAMNGIGHGFEAHNILSLLAAHETLFITENDPLTLKLALHLHDFSPAITQGRLILLLGDDLTTLLSEFFQAQPGYNIIEEVVRSAGLNQQANQAYAQKVTQAMESASEKNIRLVKELLKQQKQFDTPNFTDALRQQLQKGDFQKLRAANCTCANNPTDYCVSRDVLTGLQQLGAKTDWMTFNRPDVISPIAQLTRLQQFKPHLIILVDTLRGEIATQLPQSAVCLSFLRNPSDDLLQAQSHAEKKLASHDLILPCRSDHTQTLKAHYPQRQILQLPLAADTQRFQPAEPSEAQLQKYASDVAFVANRYSTNPELYQIKLATHQQLWNTIIEDIHQQPEKYQPQNAGKYVIRAQRCGVELRDKDLRTHLTKLVCDYFGASALYDSYMRALQQDHINLRIWSWTPLYRPSSAAPGSTWSESPAAKAVAGTINYDDELNTLFNAAKIHLHIPTDGRLDATLLNGIAAGAFFLVRSHPAHHETDGLGKAFKLDREIITFNSPKDLIRKVRYYLNHDAERRQIAQVARQKVLAHYSTAGRMAELLGALKTRLE